GLASCSCALLRPQGLDVRDLTAMALEQQGSGVADDAGLVLPPLGPALERGHLGEELLADVLDQQVMPVAAQQHVRSSGGAVMEDLPLPPVGALAAAPALTVHGADGDAAHVHRQADLVPLGDVALDAVEVLATAGHALGDSVELLGVVVVVVARHALAGDPLALAVVAG